MIIHSFFGALLPLVFSCINFEADDEHNETSLVTMDLVEDVKDCGKEPESTWTCPVCGKSFPKPVVHKCLPWPSSASLR